VLVVAGDLPAGTTFFVDATRLRAAYHRDAGVAPAFARAEGW
jgi:hypothetical protein